jgi:hypothetical protein
MLNMPRVTAVRLVFHAMQDAYSYFTQFVHRNYTNQIRSSRFSIRPCTLQTDLCNICSEIYATWGRVRGRGVGTDAAKCFHICPSDLHAIQLEKVYLQVNRVNALSYSFATVLSLSEALAGVVRRGRMLKTPVTGTL